LDPRITKIPVLGISKLRSFTFGFHPEEQKTLLRWQTEMAEFSAGGSVTSF
jgi:hypothetical protein